MENSYKICSKLLSFLIFMGWIFGCILSSTPFLYSKSNSSASWSQNKKKSFYKQLILYYVLSSFLIPSISVYQTAVNVVNNFTKDSSVSLSEIIIRYVVYVVLAVFEIARRIFFLTHYSLIIQTLDKLNRLRSHHLNLNQMSWTGQNSIDEHEESSSSFNKTNNNFNTSTCILAIFIIYLIIGSAAYVLFFLSLVLLNIDCSIARFYLGSTSLDIEIVGSIFYTYSFVSRLLTVGLVVLIGFILIDHYEKLILIFIKHSWRNNTLLISQNRSSAGDGHLDDNDNHDELLQIAEKFQLIQQSFIFYNSLSGFLIIICVAESSILTLAYFYVAIQSFIDGCNYIWNFANCCGGVAQFINLYLIAAIGQLQKSTMTNAKEQVRSFLLNLNLSINQRERFSNIHQNRIMVGNYILKWRWKLTACDFFNADYKLFLMVSGFTMTYVMFMFQLKISEETSGLKITMNDTKA